jgi:CO/xanthine dehydrogenase FAD-binding subunit
MKPALFDYHDPESVEEAVELLAEWGDDAAVLAGGQSLVPLLNLRLARPAAVIDLRRLPVAPPAHVGDVVHVGATVTVTQLLASAELASLGAGVEQALGEIGHPQIRNRGTVGGGIAHADPAAELPAVLVALDGAVTFRSRAGSRDVAAGELFEGPFATSRRPDELLVSVALPVLDATSATVELARRPGDFALAGAFVARGPAVARIVAFAVADRPVRLVEAEEALAGGAPVDEVAALVRGALEPRGDIHASGAYRRDVTGTLVQRALERLEVKQ